MRARRVGPSALTVFAGVSIISSGLVSAFLAGTHVTQFAQTAAATTTCGAHPATAAATSATINSALAQLDSASAVQLSAAATPTPTTTATASAQASSTSAAPTASATSTATPTASASSSASASPTASATPTASPTPSTSPTPTPTPTTSSPVIQMCVSVQAISTSVAPGGTASYAIWVWPLGGEAKGITVTASAKVTAAITPKFSVCPSASGATCAVGTLDADQADELLAEVAVPKTAATGQHATLTAAAKATGATAATPASVTALISATAAATPGATSPSSGSSGVGATLPAGLLPLTPSGLASSSAALPFLPGPTTDPGGLFPTVAPASPSPGTQPNSRGAPVTEASDSLPLSTRLLGGQVLGLAVLAAALVIAIARLSLREPHGQHAGGQHGGAHHGGGQHSSRPHGAGQDGGRPHGGGHDGQDPAP